MTEVVGLDCLLKLEYYFLLRFALQTARYLVRGPTMHCAIVLNQGLQESNALQQSNSVQQNPDTLVARWMLNTVESKSGHTLS